VDLVLIIGNLDAEELRDKYLTPPPRSRLNPEKLTSPQPVKKFTTFYGTRRFITAFTISHHLPQILSEESKNGIRI